MKGKSPKLGAIKHTAYSGGASNLGTVFRLGADGAGYTVLRSFTGTTTNGGKPLAALIEGMDGALYGTTFVGGSSNRGTVFKLNEDGTGYDVVYAVRQKRYGEPLMKRLMANLFYRFINYFSETPIPKNTGDFRLMDRRVVDVLNQLPERTRFMKGLFAWVGFKQIGIA